VKGAGRSTAHKRSSRARRTPSATWRCPGAGELHTVAHGRITITCP
jgi:hypothetical protein